MLPARTVCRDELLGRIVTAVAESVEAGHARFDLILGPRGAGKSHLIGLVEHALRERLGDTAALVSLPEDFHPGSLLHLLARVLEGLVEPDEFKHQRAVLAEPGDGREAQAAEMIHAATQARPLVLVAENLDAALSAIGRRGQKLLRGILQTRRTWSVVASARELVPAFSKESEPLFGTFVEHRLTPLSAECCREMLAALADHTGKDTLAEELRSHAGFGLVSALRHVLGGYPRAMALVFPHLGETTTASLEGALEDLAEDLTPYFQEQVARLSSGQRPVAELLAESWRPLSVTEISQATLAAQATTSTHLRHLRRNALVITTKVGREVFYELADPLFRISRAMKTQRLRATTLRLAASLDATGESDAALARLKRLPRGELLVAFSAMASVGALARSEGLAVQPGPLSELVRLFGGSFAAGAEAIEDRRQLAARLATNGGLAEASLIREAMGLDMALHLREPELFTALLQARNDRFSDLESAELSRGLAESWFAQQIDGLGPAGASALWTSAGEQSEPIRATLRLAAALAGPLPVNAVSHVHEFARVAAQTTNAPLSGKWVLVSAALAFEALVTNRPPSRSTDAVAASRVVRIGLLMWISSGRAMRQVGAAADTLIQWESNLDRRVLEADDADSAFGMLPEIERETVRGLARAFGHEERVAALDLVAPPRDY